MLTQEFIAPIWVTLKLAAITTLLLLVIGTPMAWWLANTRSRLKNFIEAIISLPLVLPPTVLGFYLLIAFSPDGFIGSFWATLGGGHLAFSFPALVIASVLYSMPFVVQPLQAGFENINPALRHAAATLGASPLDRFFSIVVPLSYRGFFIAMTLGFAHTIGEFGVVLMIGGNIPGVTQVLSISIYDHVESMEYGVAHIYSTGLLIFSFFVLFFAYRFNRKLSVRL